VLTRTHAALFPEFTRPLESRHRTSGDSSTHPTADAKVHIRPPETAETVGVAVPATILEPRELPYPW
jgi:hypothetical protein